MPNRAVAVGRRREEIASGAVWLVAVELLAAAVWVIDK